MHTHYTAAESRLVRRTVSRPDALPTGPVPGPEKRLEVSNVQAGAPNVSQGVNQRMNETGQRLGMSRKELMQQLIRQRNAIVIEIENRQKYMRNIVDLNYRQSLMGAQRARRGFDVMKGQQALNRRTDVISGVNGTAELERQRDQLAYQIMHLSSQEQAGLPDHMIPADIAASAQVNRLQVLGTGERPARPPAFATLQQSASRDVVEAMKAMPDELRDVASQLYLDASTPEQQLAVMGFVQKSTTVSEDLLRSFFKTCFDAKGEPLDPATLKADPADPESAKAIEFMKTLSPAERRVAADLLRKAKSGPETALKFDELAPEIQARILKYVKRWNDAEPESADREIAEGMLYLDSVDVEMTLGKGKTIDEKKIVMLDKDRRFFGLLSGLIKVAHGLRRKLGGEKPKTADAETRKPEEMTPEERTAEIAKNKATMTELEERKKTKIPAEIERLEGEIKKAKPEDVSLMDQMKAKIRDLKAEMEAIPAKIKALEERNAALAAVVEKKKDAIPESSRVAYEKSLKESVEIKIKYRLRVDVGVDPSQNYDRTLIVLERLEKSIQGLNAEDLRILRNATSKGDAEIHPAFSLDGVSLMLRVDADGAAKKVAASIKDSIQEATIDADPRVRFGAEKAKFLVTVRAEFDRYVAELEKNPLIAGMLARMGVKTNTPEFKEALARLKPEIMKGIDAFVNSMSIEKNDAGLFRAAIDLTTIRSLLSTIVSPDKVDSTVTEFVSRLEKEATMTREGDKLVSPYMTIEALLGNEFVKGLVDPVRRLSVPAGETRVA